MRRPACARSLRMRSGWRWRCWSCWRATAMTSGCCRIAPSRGGASSPSAAAAGRAPRGLPLRACGWRRTAWLSWFSKTFCGGGGQPLRFRTIKCSTYGGAVRLIFFSFSNILEWLVCMDVCSEKRRLPSSTSGCWSPFEQFSDEQRQGSARPAAAVQEC